MHNEKERPTEYFPDGTPIDDWFYDIGMPELEELGRPYVLTEYGIWDDGKVYTKEIQKVIDLAAEEGGGVLVVPPGTYLTGALYFKQGVNLYVSAGATLKGSDDISDYDLAETRIEGETCLYFTALINADGLNGFTMCGPGTIDGNGLKTWKACWLRWKWSNGTNKDGQTIWRCRICGYEYVGEELPDDFICPLCKHPASDFEKVVKKTEVK